MEVPLRPLRGGCQCGRNHYQIDVPVDRVREAQVLFNTEPIHQIPLATPLAAYIRVPLSWHRSTTLAQFPDETPAKIRRVYERQDYPTSRRHFCGYCGTPLAFWTEEPAAAADFINLTLGSLRYDDLHDLEDMGIVPGGGDSSSSSSDEGGTAANAAGNNELGAERVETGAVKAVPPMMLRQSHAVPWLETLLRGSRLWSLSSSQGVRLANDEWEIIEYWETSANDGNDACEADEEDDAMVDVGGARPSERPGKRKLHQRELADSEGPA